MLYQTKVYTQPDRPQTLQNRSTRTRTIAYVIQVFTFTILYPLIKSEGFLSRTKRQTYLKEG